MRATSVPREVQRPYCRLQFIGDALGDSKADHALALIRSCPDGATRSELGQRLFGKHRREGLDRVLDLLRSSGLPSLGPSPLRADPRSVGSRPTGGQKGIMGEKGLLKEWVYRLRPHLPRRVNGPSPTTDVNRGALYGRSKPEHKKEIIMIGEGAKTPELIVSVRYCTSGKSKRTPVIINARRVLGSFSRRRLRFR